MKNLMITDKKHQVIQKAHTPCTHKKQKQKQTNKQTKKTIYCNI